MPGQRYERASAGFSGTTECSPVIAHHESKGASTVQRRPVAAYSIVTLASKS